MQNGHLAPHGISGYMSVAKNKQLITQAKDFGRGLKHLRNKEHARRFHISNSTQIDTQIESKPCCLAVALNLPPNQSALGKLNR